MLNDFALCPIYLGWKYMFWVINISIEMIDKKGIL